MTTFKVCPACEAKRQGYISRFPIAHTCGLPAATVPDEAMTMSISVDETSTETQSQRYIGVVDKNIVDRSNMNYIWHKGPDGLYYSPDTREVLTQDQIDNDLAKGVIRQYP